MAESADCQHHAVAVPLPFQGHINPLMRFCKLLASRHAFLITFVNIDPIHDRLLSLQQQQQQSRQRSQQEAADDSVPLDELTLRGRIRLDHVAFSACDLSNDYRVSLECVLEAQQGICEGLEKFIRGLNPPATCIISDVGMTSPTQLVADRLGIPRVMLYASSQFSHMFLQNLVDGRLSVHAAITMAQECNPKTYDDPAHEGYLEGLVQLNKRDLLHFKHVVDDTKYMYHFLCRELRISYERAHAVILNSFTELEYEAIEAYRRLPNKPPLYHVGPLIEELSNETSTSLWKEDDGCITWLNKQPSQSVLYISLGSFSLLSENQFKHMLAGLESSNQRFLWSFRPDLIAGTMASIPEEFLRKTSDRGYIADWVPQFLVLKHPSIHAFLTHCGWNSTMEGITTGVPMLCWPYFADQFMDAKYIIDVWKVGLAFESSSNGSEISLKEIEQGIRAIMEGEEGKVVRENVRKLKEAAFKCQSGSSQTNMDAFIQGLPKNFCTKDGSKHGEHIVL